MDDQLESIKRWFTSLNININEDKLKRQLSIINSWFKYKCIGCIECVTGFGKTYVAIISIHRLNLKYPDASIIVVVPTTKLFKDWQDHITNFNLQNVQLFIVNTYTMNYVKTGEKYKCTFLIVDEVHRVLSQKGKLFNKTLGCTQYNMLLGLSATLDDEEKNTLADIHVPIVDIVSMSEARRFNYIADYIIYNLAITLSPEQREEYSKHNDLFNAMKAKFEYFMDFTKNLQLVRACAMGKGKDPENIMKSYIGDEKKTGQEWRQWYAEKMDFIPERHGKDHPWHPTNIYKYAIMYNKSLASRKSFLYNSHAKIQATREIAKKFRVPTITFAETISFVNALTHDLNLFGIPARAYHSELEPEIIYEQITVIRSAQSAKKFRKQVNGDLKYDESIGKFKITYDKQHSVKGKNLKQKIINDFEDGLFNVLCTARALDEGFNVEGIEIAIICSATSKRRTTIQRNGRALRFKPDKVAKIINLYHPDTQDEAWLRTRQKGETNIRHITSIDQIE